jgi:LuxR family transcriptional regulator, maltose regulon positive regulatory protein
VRDVLLATKLYVPGPQPGFVARHRLAHVLAEGLSRPFVLVSAPAGAGKTALLADWARSASRDRGLAWLSLDAGDNDPVRFWRHVVGALDRVRAGISERVGPLPDPASPRSLESFVTALINDLARPEERETLLVLDDYHLIDALQVHSSLVFLIDHMPAGLHLVVASRSDPALPLARLRAAGKLAEIRAAALKFTTEEAAALLREAVGELPDDAVRVLAARTEGWAAGLQLAALSLRGRANTAAFLADFGGSHRYVLDYLAEEVLDRQPAHVREFLLETSVLDRLSGELCDAITGRADGQVLLEDVERANLFLVPLDEVRGWWRYHPLFADMLRARLQQELPGRAAELQRAAATWWEESGVADEAVRHAVAAGDVPRAVRLIEEHFDEVFLSGERATWQRWLAAMPAEVAGSHPRLWLAQTWMALVGNDVETAAAALERAERALADDPGVAGRPFEPSVGTSASRLANVRAAAMLERGYLGVLRGDAEGAATFAAQALAEIGPNEWMLDMTGRWQLALADLLRGDLAAAEGAFTGVITAAVAAGERGLAAASCHLLGQVQRAQGRLTAAADTYQQVLEITSPPGRPVMPAAGIAYVGLAEVAYQRGELDVAERRVAEGIDRCRQLNFTQPLATGMAALAWIRQAHGDPAGARAAMSEAERTTPPRGGPGLLNPVPAQRARLQVAQGATWAAARWATERGLNPDDEPTYPQEPEYLAFARVLLAQDRPVPALALLDKMLAAAIADSRTGSVIEIQALRALALEASGAVDAAVDALARAVALALPEAYVRIFADEGAPMSALLTRLVAVQKTDQIATAKGIPLGWLAQILRAPGTAGAADGSAPAGVAAVPGLVEQLTARELEILVLLAAGTPNPRIAEQLVITLDTVKKHVSHVLGKLGAANRTEAVTRARQLGLIP